MYIHICIYVCVYIYTYIHLYFKFHVLIYIHVHIYVYIYVHICVYLFIYLYIYLFMFISLWFEEFSCLRFVNLRALLLVPSPVLLRSLSRARSRSVVRVGVGVALMCLYSGTKTKRLCFSKRNKRSKMHCAPRKKKKTTKNLTTDAACRHECKPLMTQSYVTCIMHE